jgi:hypothetical protein
MYLLSDHDNPSERLSPASIINTYNNVLVYITLMHLNGYTQSRKLFVFSACMHYLCELPNDVRFQVLMAASMKMTVFWDIAPCCLAEIDRLHGATSQKAVISLMMCTKRKGRAVISSRRVKLLIILHNSFLVTLMKLRS